MFFFFEISFDGNVFALLPNHIIQYQNELTLDHALFCVRQAKFLTQNSYNLDECIFRVFLCVFCIQVHQERIFHMFCIRIEISVLASF